MVEEEIHYRPADLLLSIFKNVILYHQLKITKEFAKVPRHPLTVSPFSFPPAN
jgi:hypothetical protein